MPETILIATPKVNASITDTVSGAVSEWYPIGSLRLGGFNVGFATGGFGMRLIDPAQHYERETGR